MLELIYILYILSGYIKSLMIAFSISNPIDITLLFAFILIFFLLKKRLNYNKRYLHIIIVFFIFIVWILFTTFYTSSDEYWEHKFIYFFTNFIALIIPLLIYKNFSLDKSLLYFVLISTILNVIFTTIILPYIYVNELYYQVSGTYLATAVMSGLSILMIVIQNIKIKSKYITGVFLLINFITLFGSGGRGGLIFTFLVLSLFILFQNIRLLRKAKISKILFKILFLIVITIVAVSIYYNKYAKEQDENESDIIIRSINRLILVENMLNDKDAGSSVNTRIELINFSINKIFHDPLHFIFGYGFGSFGIEYNGVDKREYPHNIILEIWFELGFIGVLIFLYLLFYIFRILKKSNMVWIFLFMLLNVLKSNNLVDIRIFIAIIAIGIIDKQGVINEK